jgi:hypothetical protein
MAKEKAPPSGSNPKPEAPTPKPPGLCEWCPLNRAGKKETTVEPTAEERIAEALTLNPAGIVEVKADDITAVCSRCQTHLEGAEATRFDAIRRGSANAPGLDVNLHREDLLFLLDVAVRG